MLVCLILLFTLVPLIELVLLVEVGAVVGVGFTVLTVLATGVLGAWLARLQGLRTLQALRGRLAEGRLPTEALIDGVLILAAGAVLLTPGFLTDGLGFFLLVPAGRAAVRRRVLTAIRRRVDLRDSTVINAHWRREDE